MDVQPVDLTALVATFMGISVILVPILGLTVRFAFKPLVEAIVLARGGRAREAELEFLQRRVELLERQVEQLQRELPAPSGLRELPERTRSSVG